LHHQELTTPFREVIAYPRQRRMMQTRQQARFLCGLTSPALTSARLSRHALFGTLEAYPFAEVLAWCAAPDPAV